MTYDLMSFSTEQRLVLAPLSPVGVLLGGRGQHVAQTPTPAAVLHAPGGSERRQQFRLRPLIQSPQLLQLLRYLHEPLGIQQPHEPRRKRALPTGQSVDKPHLSVHAPTRRWCSHSSQPARSPSSTSPHCSEHVIVFDLN